MYLYLLSSVNIHLFKENGIFDALLRGVLHAVQFTVIGDKASPHKVLESHTFTFDNFGERGTADRLTNGLRMDFVSPYCTDDEARAAVHSIRKLGIMTSIDGKKNITISWGAPNFVSTRQSQPATPFAVQSWTRCCSSENM